MLRRAMLGGLAAGLATSLGACGFHPVYGAGQPGQAALAQVYVNIIPNRSGQLLRQALQARLEGSNADAPKRYTLAIGYADASQGISVQENNFTTRIRSIGTAYWSLHPVDNAAATLAGGTARSLDGYNIIDEQFFYQDLSEDAVQRRMAEALSGQIVLALARYFDKHPGVQPIAR